MIFISVNTPTKTKGIGAGKASDLKWVESSARQIAKNAKGLQLLLRKARFLLKLQKLLNLFSKQLKN